MMETKDDHKNENYPNNEEILNYEDYLQKLRQSQQLPLVLGKCAKIIL